MLQVSSCAHSRVQTFSKLRTYVVIKTQTLVKLAEGSNTWLLDVSQTWWRTSYWISWTVLGQEAWKGTNFIIWVKREADFESCQGALSSQIPIPAPKIYTGFDDFQQSFMSFQALENMFEF